MTLTDFLLARIAEDEAAAQRVGPTRYYLYDAPRRAKAETAGGVVLQQVDDRSPAEAVALFDHNARHQPGRVLAECEARRRIVVEHRAVGEDHDECSTCGQENGWTGDGDGGEWFDPDRSPVEFPCPTLRALALPYADHEDYDEGWKP